MESEEAILALAALAQSTRLDVFRLLVKHEPEGLAAGDIVTTGSLQGATPAAPGTRAVGNWGRWGRVMVNIAG